MTLIDSDCSDRVQNCIILVAIWVMTRISRMVTRGQLTLPQLTKSMLFRERDYGKEHSFKAFVSPGMYLYSLSIINIEASNESW